MRSRVRHEIPYGYCHCGCGKKTTIAPQTDTGKGYIKGDPRKYIVGHKGHAGSEHWNWRGGKFYDKKGYVLVYSPTHPNSNAAGYVREHILIAEKALGKFLPEGVVVHHANESKNSGPLIICENEAYHRLLHQRMRAYKACGHANWRKCPYCKRYDDINNMINQSSGCAHRLCRINYLSSYRKNQKGSENANASKT